MLSEYKQYIKKHKNITIITVNMTVVQYVNILPTDTYILSLSFINMFNRLKKIYEICCI